MKNYWFISDTHFNHKKILNFKNYDGTLMRDFSSIEEHNETIIDNWNKVVKPQDIVFHLGDVILSNRVDYDKILSRLNGKNRLVLGNHDKNREKDLRPYFKKITGARMLKIGDFKCILSHIPLHPDCVKKFGLNIHGHIHNNLIMKETYHGAAEEDDRYMNVCVERTNYKPVNLEEIK